MLIDIGNKYINLNSDEDYLRVIEEKISYEFADELRCRFNRIQECIEELRENSDISYFEQENEVLRNLIDDVNSMLQSYIFPIKKGKRLYREKTINFFNEVIKYLDNK